MGIKKFKFRLEKVLQYREGVKEDKKRVVLLCNQKLNEETALLEEYEAAWSRNALREDAIMTVEEVQMTGIFTLRLKDNIEKQRIRIEEARKKVDEAMNEYVEAAKDVQTLETLKERKAEEYRKYIEHEEMKFLDELTTQKGNTLQDTDEAEGLAINTTER